MTIVEFLLARIAEDEHRFDLPDAVQVDSAHGEGWVTRADCPLCGRYMFEGTEVATEEAWWEHVDSVHERERVLAECKAKRSILNAYPAQERWIEERMLCEMGPRMVRAGWEIPPALYALAAIFADHADFDEAWRVV